MAQSSHAWNWWCRRRVERPEAEAVFGGAESRLPNGGRLDPGVRHAHPEYRPMGSLERPIPSTLGGSVSSPSPGHDWVGKRTS